MDKADTKETFNMLAQLDELSQKIIETSVSVLLARQEMEKKNAESIGIQ